MTSLARLCRAAALTIWAVTVAADAVPAPGPSMPNTAANCNKWYQAGEQGTCTDATKAGGINLVKFRLWNPDVSKDCTINWQPGYYYCIGVDENAPTTRPSSTVVSTSAGATSFTASRSTSVIATATQNETYSIRYPTTTWNITTPTRGTEFPPKETKPGQPSYCIDWHFVDGGDTCLTIANRYNMRVDDLLDWNPTLNDDCSGLAVFYWVCVRIQPQSSLTLTYGSATAPISVPEGTPWVTTTWPAVDPSFTASPTQGDVAENCAGYYKAAANDRCTNVLEQFPMITEEQFFSWNPFLEGNCDGLWSNYYYCVFAGSQDTLPDPESVNKKPSSGLAPGVSSDCVRWYQTSGGDDCDLIVSIFGRFSKSDFVSWNPSVGSDCAGIQDDLYYCVAVGSTPTTRTAAVPPFPTGSDDSTTTTNGAVTTTTTSGSRTSTLGSSSTTSGAVTTPTPILEGMIQGCKTFYKVKSGDGCWAIANTAGIAQSDFYKWNPAIDSKCLTLVPDVYVCVGV